MSGWVETINWSILLRLCFALVLGGLIGLEREIHGRPAGLRTHIMVCLGATMIMISSEFLMHISFITESAQSVKTDPGRIVAGIVTGIGFLGAGAIIRIGDLIRGLTTAACIWFAATLGVVIGSGYFGLGIVTTGLVLIVLILLNKLESHIPKIEYRKLVIRVYKKRLKLFEDRATQLLLENHIQIKDKQYHWDKKSNEVEIIYQIRTRSSNVGECMLFTIGEIEEVIAIDWE